MISETTIHRVGGSLMMLIPDAYVKHFKLDKTKGNSKCKIKDVGYNEAKLIFNGGDGGDKN